MINEQMIFVGEDINTKQAAIDFVVKQAYEQGFIHNQEQFAKAVWEREQMISTFVGHFIAIPHGRSDVVKEPFIAYLKTKDNFYWDSEKDGSVHSIFLIGVPESDGDKTHLRFISQVSKNLIKDDFRKQLFAAKSKAETFKLLNLINEDL